MLISMLLAAAAPQPGELKTFTDWTVGCDNGRACQAVALLSEPGLEGASLAITRGSATGAAPRIWITARDANGGDVRPAALLIDGKRYRLGGIEGNMVAPADVLAVARRLGQAARIRVIDARGGELGAIATGGSAAALLYMDEQQRRVGTTGALVRRGTAARVPPAPALPVIVRPIPPNRAARTMTVARARQLLGAEATQCEYPQPGPIIVSVRLDAKTSLALVSHPCGNGAYNFWSTPHLVDEAGKTRLASFDAEGGMGEEGGEDASLVNADWDAKARRLTTFAKGRGLGDCGTNQSFAWDGVRFRLVHQEQMGECRGSTDYITTWRALVIGRR